MKKYITKQEFNELPIQNQLFLALWKEAKQDIGETFSYGDLTELAFALTNDLHFDTPAENNTFNNLLEYKEYQVAWDGIEPIEVLWFELNKNLQKRINGYLVVNSRED